jgi:hypothetical protein
MEFRATLPETLRSLDSMPLLELYAMTVGVVAAASSRHTASPLGRRTRHHVLHPVVDCQPVWLAATKGRAPRFKSRTASRAAATLWRLALRHADQAGLSLVPLWVPREQLQHADALSRDITLTDMTA